MNESMNDSIGVKIKNNTNRLVVFNLFIFFFSIYFLTASLINFYNTDASQLRIEVARSIVERFDLSIPDGYGVKGADGKDYSWFGIGSALMSVPFYITAKLIGIPPEGLVSKINQLVSAATVVLVFLFSLTLGFSRRASLSTSFFYGLGTMAWPLAKQPFDHNFETFFVLLSVYYMYRHVINKKDSYLFLSSIFLGIAFITRLTSILVLLPLYILIIFYYLKKYNFKDTLRLVARNIALFSITFLPFVCLILWYNYYRFGSVFETGYSLIAARTGLDFFTGTSLLTGLNGFLASPGKGFFYYSPVAVFFFFSIKPFMRRHPGPAACFICIIISYLVFLSKNIYWHGDWAWGPRYLFVITPFLMIPIAELFDSIIWPKKALLRKVVYSIFTVSLLIQLAAVSVAFQKYFFDLRYEKKVQFTVVHGDGVQPIVEPPPETYFDWHKSPILAHFRFVHEIAGKIKEYRYTEPPKNSVLVEKIKVQPWINVFDFWWLYKYFLEGSFWGFIAAIFLFLLAVFSASRLWKAVNHESAKRPPNLK